MNTSEKAISDSGLTMNLSSETCSDQVLTDEQMRPIQVYQLKNQPQMKKCGLGHGGKRVKGTEHVKDPQNIQNKGGRAWTKRMMNPPALVSLQAGGWGWYEGLFTLEDPILEADLPRQVSSYQAEVTAQHNLKGT